MNREAAASYSRLAGAALGTMCGDALGMPVEGWSTKRIAATHGLLQDMLPGRLPTGSYTDDSQMMLAILQTLAERGRLDPAYLAERFAALFDPARGYGGRIFGVMDRIRAGQPWDQVGTDSFGNGGAMRVGVLGAFHADSDDAIIAAAQDQCRITHHHARGLAGAATQALAVGLACRMGAAGEAVDHQMFINHLATAVEPIDGHTAQRLGALALLHPADEDEARRMLVAEYACDVTAPESVPPAIGGFLFADNAEQAITLAVSLGGDTDTIGAMAGAIAGGYWGVESLPRRWLEALENEKHGRDHALQLCRTAITQKLS